MPDVKNVIKGLECCGYTRFMDKCQECPYDGKDCFKRLKVDALALLKAQEPVEPVPGLWDRDIPLFNCGACGGEIGVGGIAKYCFHCGRAVKWDG